MIDELGGKIMTKFVGLKAKTQLLNEDKKEKRTKKCAIKRKLKFQNYKNWLEAIQLENKINHLEKNEINIGSIKKITKNS